MQSKNMSDANVNYHLPNLDFSREIFGYFEARDYKPGQGVNRLGYSPDTKHAADYLSQQAIALGAQVYEDIAGVRYLVWEPRDWSNRERRALLTGSHLDAVPKGGRYDGMLGIVAGIEAVKAVISRGRDLPAPVAVVMYPNEESSGFEFASSSKIATGQLNPKTLDKLDNLGSGMTLIRAMCDHHGLDEAAIRQAVADKRALFDIGSAAAFVETHIQQNDQLARDGFDIGVVTAIKGTFRCGTVKFTGRADHSGACPQEDRRDAGMAMCRFISMLEDKIDEIRKTHPDITLSVGDVKGPEQGSLNIISEDAAVLFDIRSESVPALMDARETVLETLPQAIARRYTVAISIDEAQTRLQQPTKMDAYLNDAFMRVAGELGLRAARVPCGPGHDAGILQNVLPSMVLLSAHKGGSHHPDEIMTVNKADDAFAPDSPYAALVKSLCLYVAGEVVVPATPPWMHPDAPSPFVRGLLANGARRLG
jgi:N-carbamoyl-L-amino-acid hydrolase